MANPTFCKKPRHIENRLKIFGLILYLLFIGYSLLRPEPYIPPEPSVTRQYISTLEHREALYHRLKPQALGEERSLTTQEISKLNSLLSSVNTGLSFEVPYYRVGQNFDNYDATVTKMLKDQYQAYEQDLELAKSPPVNRWPDPYDYTGIHLILLIPFLIASALQTRRSYLEGYRAKDSIDKKEIMESQSIKLNQP